MFVLDIFESFPETRRGRLTEAAEASSLLFHITSPHMTRINKYLVICRYNIIMGIINNIICGLITVVVGSNAI